MAVRPLTPYEKRMETAVIRLLYEIEMVCSKEQHARLPSMAVVQTLLIIPLDEIDTPPKALDAEAAK